MVQQKTTDIWHLSCNSEQMQQDKFVYDICYAQISNDDISKCLKPQSSEVTMHAEMSLAHEFWRPQGSVDRTTVIVVRIFTKILTNAIFSCMHKLFVTEPAQNCKWESTIESVIKTRYVI